MTRSATRRTPASRPRPAPVLSLDGNPACPPSEAQRWTIVAIAVIALFGAFVLYAIARLHPIGDYFTESDFYGAYAQGARLIQHGRLLPSRYTVIGPGYEIALAVVGLVVRNLFVAAELLSAASAVCIAACWFALLRRRVDARLATAAVVFTCANDGLFRYAYSATTDAFGIALQAAALFALLGAPATAPDARGPRMRRFAAAGLLAACAFLTRYNAIVLLPAGVVAILAGGAGATRRGRAALAFTAAFLAPVLPWIAYSLAHGGTLGTQLHHNIAYEVFARSRGIAWDEYQKRMQSQFPNLGAVIARDPGAVASRMAFNVVDHLRQDAAKLLGWPVALAALAGIVLALRAGWTRALWPVVLAGALLFLTLVPVFYSERYSLALLPVYATLAGAAFATPALALAAGRGRRVWLKAALVPVVVALVLPASIARGGRALEQLPFEVLDAGRALHSLRAPGDRVISRKAHIAFYGDCEPEAFPFADSLSQLARAAREAHARWLFMSWPEAETRPRFWYLLDTTATVPGLTARFSSSRRPAVVYEIGPGFGETPAWLADPYQRAYHVLRARTAVSPGDPRLQSQLGQVCWWLGHLPEGRDALDRAVTLNPGDREAWTYLGRIQSGLGDHAQARLAYGRALQIEPRDADARVGYGYAAFMLHDDREAAEAWRPVIAATVEPRILNAMAQLYDSLGDAEAAREARVRLAEARTR